MLYQNYFWNLKYASKYKTVKTNFEAHGTRQKIRRALAS